MAIATLGIDLAKSVFHVHGRDAEGRPVFQKRFSRAALMKFMANLPVCPRRFIASVAAYFDR